MLKSDKNSTYRPIGWPIRNVFRSNKRANDVKNNLIGRTHCQQLRRREG